MLNGDNVWANVQENGDPVRMRWDLAQRSDWRPFFAPSFPSPQLSSVQSASLSFPVTDPHKVAQLERRLTRLLCAQVDSWRAQRFTTRWNKAGARALRSLLPHFEYHQSAHTRGVGGTEDALGERHRTRLADIHAS